MAVTASQLTVGYREKVVLTRFSHRFEDNSVTCIFSPSGSGKTTLLHTIAGIIPPLGGSLTVDSKRISMIFQENRLLMNLTAFSNVKPVCPEKSAEEIEAALAAVGLGEDIYTPVKNFSGGMCRRVAAVRALLYDADTYLFDEPFTGLDSDSADALIRLIKRFCHEKTVIIATHDESLPQKLDAGILRL